MLAGTDEGDLVLDPFTGSSTTGLAAYLYGRKFIGIDKEKEYLDLSIKRFEDLEKNMEEKGMVKDLLEDVPGISSLILYGSYARGENDMHSDLDLLIISTAKKVDASKISKKIGVMVNVMNFTSTQWTKQAKDNRAFYLDVITEGIVLHGTRPVVE